MAAVQGGDRFAKIAEKWHGLAQRRLASLTELYSSGRWKHYYDTREQFASDMRDAALAATRWAKLADKQPAPVPSLDDLRPAA
jgi:uncharacterized repeat protein (TIGR03809 family)